MNDTVFCIECEGDHLYYSATTEDEAYERFHPTFNVPRHLLKFTRMTLADVPASEEVL